MKSPRFAPVISAALLFGTSCTVDPVDPPHYGVFFAFVAAVEVQGFFTPNDPGPSKVTLIRPFVAGPQLAPDFIDSPAPPFCLGFKFGSNNPPNVVNGDAGTIVIGGGNDVTYQDLTMGPMPGPSTAMPAPITCGLQDVAGTKPYVCDVPSTTLVGQGTSWLDDDTRLVVSMSGGTNVGAFSVEALTVAPSITATGGFSLYGVDPTDDVDVRWTPTNAPFVMIEMVGQLMDGSAGAQVFCLADARRGQKTVPAAALALLPEPSNTNPLFIQSSLAALDIASSYEGWGNYLIAAGRGEFGFSCRIPTGPCPNP